MQASNSRAASMMMRATRSVIEQLEERRLFNAGAVDFVTLDPRQSSGRQIGLQGNNIVALADNGSTSTLLRYDSAGTPDATFSAPVGFRAHAMLVQTDNKIVVAGAKDQNFAVERFNADGTLDTTFGNSGLAEVNFNVSGTDANDEAMGLALDGTDIIVAGDSIAPAGTDISIARLNSSGAVTVQQHADSQTGDQIFARDVAINTTNNEIVVAATDANNDQWAVEHFDRSTGAYKSIEEFNSGQPLGIAVAPDGSLVLGGYDDSSGTEVPIVTSVGAHAWTTSIDFGQPIVSDSIVSDVAVDANGKVLVGANTMVLVDPTIPDYQQHSGVARLNANDGSLDTSFGTNGSTLYDSGTDDVFSEGIAVQSDGAVLLTGNDSNGDLFLARFTGDAVAPPTNTPPVIDSVAITPSSAATNDTLTASVTSHDDDGDTVALSYQWYKNGTAIGGATGSTLDLSVAGNGDHGDSITVTVTPNDGTVDGTAVTSDPLTVANTAPTGTDDSYSVDENGTLTVTGSGVLGNDHDADGDALTAGLVYQTAAGALTLNPDGTFTYAPGPNFHGSDQFQYTANDTQGGVSAPVTVHITVNHVNQAPVAVNDSSYTTQNGTPLTVTAQQGVLANDSDVDGDALTAHVVTTTQHGTLALNPDGSFTYSAAVGFAGVDTFTYNASDGQLATSAIVSITVTAAPPTNTAPIANAGADQKVDENLPVLFDGTGSTDADGDVLSYSWDFGDGYTGAGAQPTHAFSTNGLFVVTLTVNDGHGGVSTDSMNVNVLSPQQAITDIISQVNALHDSGDLNSGNTSSLMTKLNGTVTKLSRDDYLAAEGQLAAFVAQVNGWINNGKISATDGQPLIDSATQVMASIVLDVLS